MEKRDGSVTLKSFGIILLLTLAAGVLGGWLGGWMAGYEPLQRPWFAPPPAVFPVVWGALYLLMAISAYGIYREDRRASGTALVVYWAQLLVNLLWPLLFFRLSARLLAFWWIILLILLVAAMTVLFWRIKRWCGWLQIPYLAWLVFAAVLNYAVYALNR